MRRSQEVSVGFVSHVNTTQRSNLTPRLRVCSRQSRRVGFDTQPHTHFLERKHLQAIGVYLTDFFGCNVRFRILKELGSFGPVVCVAEIVFPNKFYGARVGIPKGVLKW